MKYDPAPFQEPTGKQIGCFTAQLSPDGWIEAMYENTPNRHMTSAEVLECSRFINSFIHDCATQDVFMKYIRKYGEAIDSVTSAIFYKGDELDYVLTVSGYSVIIAPHRKEK